MSVEQYVEGKETSWVRIKKSILLPLLSKSTSSTAWREQPNTPQPSSTATRSAISYRLSSKRQTKPPKQIALGVRSSIGAKRGIAGAKGKKGLVRAVATRLRKTGTASNSHHLHPHESRMHQAKRLQNGRERFPSFTTPRSGGGLLSAFLAFGPSVAWWHRGILSDDCTSAALAGPLPRTPATQLDR